MLRHDETLGTVMHSLADVHGNRRLVEEDDGSRLTYHQAASIIRRLTNISFVAMDVVEVSPPYDHADITALAAASLIMEYLCLRAWQKGARAAPMPE